MCFRCATQGYNRCYCDSKPRHVETKSSQPHPPRGATLSEEIKKLENEIEGISKFVCRVMEYLVKA